MGGGGIKELKTDERKHGIRIGWGTSDDFTQATTMQKSQSPTKRRENPIHFGVLPLCEP